MKARSTLRVILHRLFYHFYLKRALSRTVIAKVNGFTLEIFPSVMHPILFKSGNIFAEYLNSLDFQTKDVLDMGTGSGILALTAASKGAHVIAVDKNPVAAECARQNAQRNGLAPFISVLKGDFFSPLQQDRLFDVILFNPPYLKGIPERPIDESLYAGEDFLLIERFAKEARIHLKHGGFILLILSTDSDRKNFLKNFYSNGFTSQMVKSRNVLFEEFFIYRLIPKQLN